MTDDMGDDMIDDINGDKNDDMIYECRMVFQPPSSSVVALSSSVCDTDTR